MKLHTFFTPFLAVLTLGGVAHAGDLLIVVEGQATDLIGFGMQSEPLADAQVGDSVRLAFTIQTPGTRFVLTERELQIRYLSVTQHNSIASEALERINFCP